MMSGIDSTRGHKTRTKNVTHLKKSNVQEPSNSNLLSKNLNSFRSIKKQLKGFKFKTKGLNNIPDIRKRSKQIVYESRESCNINDLVLSQNPSQILGKDRFTGRHGTNNPERRFEVKSHNMQEAQLSEDQRIVYHVKRKVKRNSNQTQKNLRSEYSSVKNVNIAEFQRMSVNTGTISESQRLNANNVREWIEPMSSHDLNEKTRSGRAQKQIVISQRLEGVRLSSREGSVATGRQGMGTNQSFHIYKNNDQFQDMKAREIDEIKKNVELYSEQTSKYQNSKPLQRSQRSLKEGRPGSRHRERE